jgi:uncharacterized protein
MRKLRAQKSIAIPAFFPLNCYSIGRNSQGFLSEGEALAMEILWVVCKVTAHILFWSFLLAFGLSFLLVWSNTHPPRYPLHTSPANYGLPFEEISFQAADGVPLKGWFVPAHRNKEGREGRPGPGPAIVISHGLGASKSDFVELAGHLSRKGFHVLLFDFRAHGDSGGRRCSLGYLEKMDLLEALHVLQGKEMVDAGRIGVYGFSLGGAVAIMTASERKEIRAVAADSAFSSMMEEVHHILTRIYHLPRFPFLGLGRLAYRLMFGVDLDVISPMACIGELRNRPVLLIAGVGDEMIPDAHAGFLYEAAEQPKELWLIQGASHGGTLSAAGPEYEGRVEKFFSSALRGGPNGQHREHS